MSEPTSYWTRPPSTEPGASPPASAPLPGSLIAAAVLLFVLAALAAFISSVMLLSGSVYDQLPNQSGLSDSQFRAAVAMGRTFATAFGVIGLLIAGVHVLAGVGILRRAGWGRILGIVLAVAALLLTLLPLIGVIVAATGPIPPGSLGTSGFTQDQVEQFYRMGVMFGAAMFGLVFAGYLFVLIALIRGGRAFNRRAE
jgi:ABC-type Fe3+ transport system permease subunit